MEIIQAHDLRRSYGATRAVDGVTFSVNEGEIFGFLGPNGAGKTTTIHILCTLLGATSGEAVIAGHSVRTEPDLVRRKIGVIFQDPSLDEKLTAEENLRLHAMLFGVPRAERQARIDAMLSLVELTDRRASVVKTFSGGMKRRLEIARGLLHEPRVLFLDEPTLGLDPQTRRRIWEYLLRLRTERKLTLFLTTHYMDEAEYCDRVAILDRGKLVALDTPAALKREVGADRVTIEGPAPERLRMMVSERYGVSAKVEGRTVVFPMTDAAQFVPRLVRDLGDEVTSVAFARPSLDDVFLHATGHGMRDEELTGMDAARVRRRYARSHA